MTEHVELSWVEKTSGKMTQQNLADQFAVVPDRRFRPRTFKLTGHCPYCLGEMATTVQKDVVPADPGAVEGQGGAGIVVRVACRCQLEHEGRPAGVLGCGRDWFTTIEKKS